MDIFLIILLLAVGIALIVKGGDWFVDAASNIAEISGIPQFIIGATIVSLGTTMPELLTSIFAAVKGEADMAVGNAVGSVIANIGLILAISLIFMPHVIKRKDYLFKGLAMVGAILLLYLLCLKGYLNAWLSLFILAIFIAFIIENIIVGKKQSISDSLEPIEKPAEDTLKKPILDASQKKKIVLKNIAIFLVGAACIVGGAALLVDNGTALATILNIPSGIIAVTIVAIGTSLPELVTTITAIVKKKHDLSVGNIIGANIIDITLILPICAMIQGGKLLISPQGFLLDMPICLAVGLIAILPALIFNKFSRWQGFALLATYISYMVILFVKFL